MKNIIIALTGFLLTGIVLSGGCIKENKSEIDGTGTVRFNPIEGGFYGIVGDNGENYDPINLGKEFQVDGLRVRFEAKKRDDLTSFHMWGKLIEIIKIDRI